MRASAGVVIRHAGLAVVLLVLASALLPAQSVTVSPASLSFGDQAISTASSAKTVTVKNGQSVALTISLIAASGDYSQTNTCGTSLAAGAKCSVNVTFTPSALGTRTGTLTITDSASNSPQTVSLTGTGVVQAALSPATESFGNQAIGTASASKMVTLDNDLPTALSISSIAVSGDYSLTNTCGTSLAAGATCSINVAFSPTTTGTRTGTLTVTDSASNSPQTVSLTGSGILQATVSPSTLSFGNQAAGTSSLIKTATLTNNLGTALTISSITTSGDYSQANTCGASLASGATCTVSVTFAPTTTGTRAGTLTVTDSASNTPQAVPLTGNGVVPVTVSPSTLAFGNEAITTTSAAKTVTVSNKQPTAVTISSITTPGVYAQNNTCGTLLVAQGTCTVSVTFSPTATGSQPGTLTLTDNATNSPQTVNLTGTGTALPTITKLSVTSGTVGTSVTITGTGFGGSQGNSNVTLNGVAASPTSWKSTSITVTVPAAATTGNLVGTVNGGPSNGVAFTVVPVITSLSTGTGLAGTSVTIVGTGFGGSQGTSTVTFNGTTTAPTAWSPSSITAPVPTGATAGNGTVVVTVSGTVSNSAAFTVVPNITSLSASSGTIGSSLTVTGTSFGSSQGTSIVAFNGQLATPTSWAPASITVPVPNGATSGNVVVTVGGFASGGAAFTVVPNISRMSSSSGVVGASVTITGTGFGNSQGTSAVTVNGIAASPTNWSATSIALPVPSSATGGNGTVVVTVGGAPSNAAPFTVVPKIASLSAISGAVGSPITISGTGFGSIQGGNTVAFNGTAASPTSWNAASITVPVPPGARTGNVVVTVGGAASAGIGFTVLGGAFVGTVGQMAVARYGHTATHLPNGKVLIAGGLSPTGVLSEAELYDPATQTFSPTGAMNVQRWQHTATLLDSGQVLITGGLSSPTQTVLNSAELYDPTSGVFTVLGISLNVARASHTATLVNTGQVLIVGGYDPSNGIIATAELYDSRGVFYNLGNTNTPRMRHTATALQNGQVLIAGGETDLTPSGAYNTAELYDPAAFQFTPLSPTMTTAREGHTATLLNNGQVVLFGGDLPGAGSLSSAEIYDPTAVSFTVIPSGMTTPRVSQVATLLNGGKVLIAGGATDSGGSSVTLNSAETYDPVAQVFTSAGTLSAARKQQTLTLLNDGTAIVVGGTDANNTFNSADLYIPSKLTGLTSIAVIPSTPSIAYGTKQLFTATGTFNDGTTQTLASALWGSSSPSVLALSNDASDSGVGTSGVAGNATVTASAAGISGSTIATVQSPPLVYISVYPSATAVPVGATIEFSVYGTYADSSTQNLTATSTWMSSDPTIATVSSSGLITGIAQGQTSIQATYGAFNSSGTIYVGPPAVSQVTVNPAATTIPVGATQQYQAIATYTDSSTRDVTTIAQWSAGVNGVARESGAGLATALNQGTTTISANFAQYNGYATLTVGPPALVSLSITPAIAGVDVGGTQQFKALGNYTDRSVQDLTSQSTWSSSNSAIATINTTGLANMLAIGSTTITASSGTISGTAALNVTTATGLDTSRYSHTATLLNSGKVLIAGGLTCPASGTCSYLNSAELYDPIAGTFDNTGSMSAARSAATAVLLQNGKVLVAGGFACDTSGNCRSVSTAEIYDPASGSFNAAGNMTASRSGATMTLLNNGTVLIAGGESCNSVTNCYALSTAEVYDPKTGISFATSNTMQAARYNAAAVSLDSGVVIVVGGFDGTNLPAQAEFYDPVTGIFSTTTPSLNTPRFSATATLLNGGRVLIAGGSTCNLPGCPTTAAEIYDPVANTFSVAPGLLNTVRFNHTATLLTNGQVVIAGGFSSCATSCIADGTTELFDPSTGVFASSQSLATPRAGHSSTLLSSGQVALIGGINSGTTVATVESYQPASQTPPALASISITPFNPSGITGQTQQFTATGTFNDGSTQTLQAVIWTSSYPGVASISNSAGSAGVADMLSTGTSTISATAGNVTGTTTLTVPGLVSLAVTPANPSIALNATQELQLTATGTYSDSSSRDISAYVTWSTSNNSVATVITNPTVPGVSAPVTVEYVAVVPVATGTTNITATLGTISGSSAVTVVVPPTPISPSIISVSPDAGGAGTQVTITGSNFGQTQGTGTVWLGTTLASVLSWSNTQVIAVVQTGSSSGVAQIQQNNLSSNAVSFIVNTAAITGISTNSGLPGTQVTVTGSGFGSTQSNGVVWLGTAPAIVNSWSDGQVVATVAAGSNTGIAQLLQNGVWSNSVPFSIDSLQVTSISPNSGTTGTAVTITGGGFGTSQGSGNVWIGNTYGVVMGWSDTQIVASVASSAVSGVVKVEQDGIWSNSVAFTVPSGFGGGTQFSIVPSVISMVVGDTRSIQAIDSTGQQIAGLSWSSSNAAVITLSTDDPPILTAIGAGTATINTGSASADVTVYAGPTLPIGTKIWSNFGDGSGVSKIVPAVPSASGGADVFALQNSGMVMALRSDGTQMWSADVGVGATLIPDFQGGLVVSGSSNQRLDGLTGQPTAQLSGNPVLVHKDGTIFLDGGISGVDAATGNQKFPAIQLEQGYTYEYFGGNCGETNANTNAGPSGSTYVGQPIIAGDGYAYFAYSWSSVSAIGGICDGTGNNVAWSHSDAHLRVLRVGTDGSSTEITLGDWAFDSKLYSACGLSCYYVTNQVGGIPKLAGALITNADQGVLYSWVQCIPDPNTGLCTPQYLLTTIAKDGGATTVPTTLGMSIAPINPGYVSPVQPVLQRADNSYIGTLLIPGVSQSMIAFTASGQQLWSQPNYTPQIATAGGGVIAINSNSGQTVTFGGSGNQSGQLASLPTQSWAGNSYQLGSVDMVEAGTQEVDAHSFWSRVGANPSGSSSASLRFQVRIDTFRLSNTATLNFSGAIKSARDTWSKQSNGTITLLWDQIVDANINPCATSGCTPADAGDLLYINSYDHNFLWQKMQYYFQKFSARTGISVVEIYYLRNNNEQAAALPTPLTQSGTFGPYGNIIVVRGDTPNAPSGSILAHEIGHVFGLDHVANPLNLMCGAPQGSDFLTNLITGFTCTSWLGFQLNDDQLKTAKAGAAQLAED